MEDYNISFEQAKEMDIYKYSQQHSIEQLRDLKNIPNIITDNVPVVLEFGNIDIELTVNEVEEDELITGYYVCVKSKEGLYGEHWESFDYTEDEVIISENLEKDMFECLMRYAQKHNLFWSKLN